MNELYITVEERASIGPHLGREAVCHCVVDAICVSAKALSQQLHKLLRLVAEEGQQRAVPEERPAPIVLDNLQGMAPLRSPHSIRNVSSLQGRLWQLLLQLQLPLACTVSTNGRCSMQSRCCKGCAAIGC